MRALLITLVLVLSGCATQYSGESPTLSSSYPVYVLPLDNQSNMPMANAQAEQLVASALAELGLNVKLYPKSAITDMQASLEPQKRADLAQKWLAQQSAGYVVSGSVQEWQYKYGLDGEPSVAITLVLGGTDGQQLWRGSISKSGWGRESLGHVGLDAVADLLDELDWE